MAYNTQEISVDNLVVEAIASFATDSQRWVGTMTQLSRKINRNLARSQKEHLPGSASALRKVIDRNLRRIRSRGISVKFSRSPDRMRTRFVELNSSK